MQFGCKECNDSGYFERIGVFEILDLNDQIRDLIVKGASSLELKEEAYKHGYRPLIVDAMDKVLKGITTLDEIDRKLIIYQGGQLWY